MVTPVLRDPKPVREIVVLLASNGAAAQWDKFCADHEPRSSSRTSRTAIGIDKEGKPWRAHGISDDSPQHLRGLEYNEIIVASPTVSQELMAEAESRLRRPSLVG